jgi:hypothetical protein
MGGACPAGRGTLTRHFNIHPAQADDPMSERRDDEGRLTILISSPLETEHVARIKAFAPQRTDVIHAPELLSTPRYVADHHGNPRA